jgi:branched-chain amino acid transport system substrate-binding protein
MKKTKVWVLVLVCLGLAACRQEKPVARIAVAAPFTGDMAGDGPAMEHAVRLAVEDAAETSPFRVELRTFDDQADPAQAVRAARLITTDPDIVAVVGHLTSGCSIAASRVYAGAGVAMITPSATSPELTRRQNAPDWPGARVVFRLPASDEVQGAFAARYAYDFLDLRRVAVLQDQTPYGTALADEFQKAFADKGGKALPLAPVARGAKNLSEPLRQILRQKPDGVFYGGVYTEFGLLLKAARAQKLRLPFLAGDGCKAPEFFDIAGRAADGAYMTVSGVPVEEMPSASDFVEKYRQRYGVAPRTYGAYAYEAGLMIMECLRDAGAERDRMIECLRSSRHTGMLGTIVFDAKGDTLKSVMTMTRADFSQKRFVPQ